MNKEENKLGASLFAQSEDLIGSDSLEEIFALNLGDFIIENLISEDLAKKIGATNKSRKDGLINQLKELISIYSLQNTLCILTFDSKKEQVIYSSIAKTIKQMLDIVECKIYLSYEFSKTNSENDIILVGSTDENDGVSFNVDDDNIVVEAFNERDIVVNKEFSAVPMYSNMQTTGVILIKNNSEKKINKKYLDLVESIALLFATSMTLQKEIDEANKIINNINSSETDLQHFRAELTALIGDLCDYQQGFVKNLANAVDAKNQYSVSHSKNTAELARELCRQLNLNEKTIDLIYYAGLLQNVGKIALPEKIFSNNGKLSEDELRQIQEHNNSGVNLLMNINFLSEVVPYVIFKTERFDGSGTPEGLSGNSIPFGSRIIAVADAYCALTSDRPYRKALDKSKAIEIIKEEASSKWDPVIIEALIQILK
ncbi:MAG: HD domain-containing phosphohydrolase [Candidatus Gastranaerophilales bacterium]